MCFRQWRQRLRDGVLVWVIAALSGCGGGGAGGGAGDPGSLWVPSDAVVADIDADGRNEILTIAKFHPKQGADTGEFRVYRQGAALPDVYSLGVYPWRMTVGDVDGDGLDDVLVADVDARVLWWLRQDPGHRGRFEAPRRLAEDFLTYQVVLADVSGDGIPDIVATDPILAAQRLRVLVQRAANRGTFDAPVDIAVAGGSPVIASGDIDGDSRVDLVFQAQGVGGVSSSSVFVLLLQTAPGVFAPAEQLAPQSGLAAQRLVIADYDRDGRQDILAYMTQQQSNATRRIIVLLQGPGVSFTEVGTSLAGIEEVSDGVFADFTDDGAIDAAVGGIGIRDGEVRARVHLFHQSGNGGFVRASSIAPQFGVTRMTAGDVNDDGRVDLVFVGDENHCQVALQSPTSPGTFEDRRFLAD